MPHFVSVVVIVGMVFTFLSVNDGIVNTFLNLLGIESINFMSEPRWFRTVYIASGVWQSFGWSSIIYLAALSGIDVAQYEAARIDGANRLGQAVHITLPGILPTIIILLILQVGRMMSVGYEKIILMYNTATYEVADVISTYGYRNGILGGDFSFGTAVDFFNNIVNFVLLLSINWVSKKVSDVSLW
jgi:putative aldouronate transport system permease protein